LKTNSSSNVQLINQIIGGAGFFLLLITVICYHDRFFWDEPYYYHNLDIVKAYGWSDAFLENEWGSAGPLYTAIHYLLLPLTQAKLPNIRFINIGLLVIIVIISSDILHRFFHENKWNALAFLSIPMTYVCAGVALTEIPSFIFLLLSLFFLFQVLLGNQIDSIKYILALLGGLFFSIAIMGRQPLLVSLFALPFLFLEHRFRNIRTYICAGLFILSSLALPIYVFSVWHGLLAPKEQVTTTGWAPFHFWLGLGYLSLITFLVAPRFFLTLNFKKHELLIPFVIGLLSLNIYFEWFTYLPMVSFFEQNFNPSISKCISSVSASILILLGLYYTYSCLCQIYNNRTNGIFVFISVAILLIAFTSIKITHQYSSRYAFQAAPFIVLQLSRFQEHNTFATFRILLGILLGWISLYSYIG